MSKIRHLTRAGQGAELGMELTAEHLAFAGGFIAVLTPIFSLISSRAKDRARLETVETDMSEAHREIQKLREIQTEQLLSNNDTVNKLSNIEVILSGAREDRKAHEDRVMANLEGFLKMFNDHVAMFSDLQKRHAVLEARMISLADRLDQ